MRKGKLIALALAATVIGGVHGVMADKAGLLTRSCSRSAPKRPGGKLRFLDWWNFWNQTDWDWDQLDTCEEAELLGSTSRSVRATKAVGE